MDERALGTGVHAAHWLAERLDAAIGMVAEAVDRESSCFVAVQIHVEVAPR